MPINGWNAKVYNDGRGSRCKVSVRESEVLEARGPRLRFEDDFSNKFAVVQFANSLWNVRLSAYPGCRLSAHPNGDRYRS